MLADLAISIADGKDGKFQITTCLHEDPRWPEVENNCDGVKPNRSQVVNKDLKCVPQYIEYHKKIQAKLDEIDGLKAAE